MNLPSIFKSTPNMKSTNNQNNQHKNNMSNHNTPNFINSNNQIPQDMFGLGIQVFKIQSRKQIAINNNVNSRSLGKANMAVRQQMQMIENPRRISNIPPIPKAKKTSAILPSINKTPSQKQYKMQVITKTDSIIGRKSADKTRSSQNKTKIDIIKQQSIGFNSRNTNPIKNKPFVVSSRAGNKSADAVPQPTLLAIAAPKTIHKQEWRNSLNTLRHFYTQYSQYRSNEQTKAGRRKNQQYLQEHNQSQRNNTENDNNGQLNFIQAYIGKQNKIKLQKLLDRQNINTNIHMFDDEQIHYYDPQGIQNFKMMANERFQLQDFKYQQYLAN